MPVYVYDEAYTSKCACFLDDDGRVYDKADSPYDNTGRHLLGRFDTENICFYDENKWEKAGHVDRNGWVYNHPIYQDNAYRVGYISGNGIYNEGPVCGSPTGKIAYMEGDGDMLQAGAAYLLLVAGRGAPRSGGSSGSSSYGSSSGYSRDEDYSSSSGSDSYRPSTGFGPPAKPISPLPGLIALAVVALILFLAFGDEWREKKEAHEAWEDARHEALMDALEDKREQEKIANTEGWVALDDSHGRFRTSFMNEGANDTFTFTYSVYRDCTVSFKIDPDSSNLKTSAYILYNNRQYSISSELNVTAGDQVVVIVQQTSGTGYYNIHAYEEDVKIENTEGWVLLDDTHGRFRTAFINEGANDTFTFTYDVYRDCKVTFKIVPDYNCDLKTTARIYYNGGDYNIYYDVRAKAGDQIVVVVEQVSGTGNYEIHAYETVD